ncbi:fimbrial protein [Pseudomonas entomophila]|uniref:fimbrial protein n=1 Tax=Pseudomonas entomophila TaxID=312306 RepID=UPI0023D7DCC0|nr:fimbrial protein [Pseudomonas entomophila]MDF0731653.1 fimbrial protein [Pseudomonas entomophila]
MTPLSKTLRATTACCLLIGMTTAQADFGEISFSGRVLAPTCTVNGGDGNLPVGLPDVNASLLSRPGDVAGLTPFQLELSNCAPGVSRVSTYFEPGPTISPDGRLIVDAGGSQNVEVQLLNNANSAMDLSAAKGNQGSQVVQIVGGNATLRYSAQYFSTGLTTPGLVATRVQYSLDYL